MAEGGGLLNRYTLQRRIEGSNPSVSARFQASESSLVVGTARRPKIRWVGGPWSAAGDTPTGHGDTAGVFWPQALRKVAWPNIT